MSSSGSGSSFLFSQLQEIYNNLPEDLKKAMNIIHIIEVKKLNDNLGDVIYDAKKVELIEKIDPQINFLLPKSLKNSKDSIIKKDLIFYKKAYENEATHINKIIEATNKLNHELYEPLKIIKINLKKHYTEFKKNFENIVIPHNGAKKGVEEVKITNVEENKKEEFEKGKSELKSDMKLYDDKAAEFVKDYDIMNKDLNVDIGIFLNSFLALKNYVTELKSEIIEGFKIFENISPELEELNDQEKIRKLTEKLLFPLKKITDLISKSEEELSKLKQQKSEEKTDLSKKMINICEDLKSKAVGITEKINQIRITINLQKIDIPPLELKEPNTKELTKKIEDMENQLEETKKENKAIQDEVYKRTKDFINQSRLDILFIIDCTNSINTYLEDIKLNFTKIIEEIKNNCPTATVYAGFVGYLDYIDLDLDDEYINIKLTTDIESINEKIKNLSSHGGGDTAEDLAGAFELGLDNDWQGISKFIILATDAPCHGDEFHRKKNVYKYDNYPEGDRENRDIKKFVKEFSQRKISLFCAKYSEETDLMFNIFKNIYNQEKKEGDQNEFSYETCENLTESIIKKAEYIYQVNRKEDINIEKEPKEINKEIISNEY